MVVDKSLIEEKLESLKNFLLQIDNMQFTRESLKDNIDVQQLLSFRLQQCVEICIDITTHIIANAAMPKAETARDAFEILGKNKIISKRTSENMGKAANFRNLIVHGYGKIDFSRIFADYETDLDQLRQFAKEIYLYLEQN